LFGAVVSRSFEVLAVERGEVNAVGLVGDEQIEHGPDERAAAGPAGEPALVQVVDQRLQSLLGVDL
jgi:hypothetical protein